jgi:hypothetical protein
MTADRDAAPAAAEWADLSTGRLDEIERTAIAASRYAAEPYRVVKDKWGVRLEEVTGGILAEHGELPEDDPYFTLLTLLPPSVVIALVRAVRPAPPAPAPRTGEPNHRLRWAIDRLERLHQRVDGSVDDFCGADDQAWPCDTMVVLAAAREAARREG